VRDPFNADESRVAFQTSDLAVRVWEVVAGRELFKVELEGVERISAGCFLADGRLLTGGSRGGLQVWDSSGRRVFESPARRGAIFRFDHSRDGRYFAALSEDDAVQIWETAPFRRMSTIPIAAGTTSRIEFSWEGSRIIAPGGPGARIWDVRSGQPITGLLEHDGMITNLYGPDGAFVTTLRSPSAPDSTQRLWAVPPRADGRPTPEWLLKLATICAGQHLSESGEVVAAAEDFATLDEVRRTIQDLPTSDPFAAWGQWIISDDPHRPIAPGFTITPAEAEKLVKEMAPVPVTPRQ
jgi:WD40 repeat protein